MKSESKKYKYIPIEDASKLQVGDILHQILDKADRKILFIYNTQMTLSMLDNFNVISLNAPWYTYKDIKRSFYQRIECPIEYVDYTTALKALHEGKRVKLRHSDLEYYKYNEFGVLTIYSNFSNPITAISTGLNSDFQYEILDD